MKLFKHRTKFEVVGAIFMVAILLTACVLGGTRIITDSSDTIVTYITNSNGNVLEAIGSNIQESVNYVNESGEHGWIEVPAGTYYLSSTLILNSTIGDRLTVTNSSITLRLNSGTVLIPTGDFDVIQLGRGCSIEGNGATIDTRSVSHFSHACITDDDNVSYGIMNFAGMFVKDLRLMGDYERNGTGILLDSDDASHIEAAGRMINGITFSNIFINGYKHGIELSMNNTEDYHYMNLLQFNNIVFFYNWIGLYIQGSMNLTNPTVGVNTSSMGDLNFHHCRWNAGNAYTEGTSRYVYIQHAGDIEITGAAWDITNAANPAQASAKTVEFQNETRRITCSMYGLFHPDETITLGTFNILTDMTTDDKYQCIMPEINGIVFNDAYIGGASPVSTTGGLQESIDSTDFNDNGGIIFVPDGDYHITTLVTINEPITLQGTGVGSHLIFDNDLSGIYIYTNVDGVTIKDLKITYTNMTTDYNFAIKIGNNVDNVHIENVYFYNADITGTAKVAGIGLFGLTSGVFVDNCVFEGGVNGIYNRENSGGKATITNCESHNLLTFLNGAFVTKNITASLNRIYDCRGAGMSIYVGTGCILSDNYINGTGASGIYLYNTVEPPPIILGNQISGFDIGIKFSNVENATASTNMFFNCGIGIDEINTCDYNLYIGNNALGCTNGYDINGANCKPDSGNFSNINFGTYT